MPSLYIHIPFCASRCPYCDFAFVVGKTHLSQRYTRAVVQELEDRLAPSVLSTVYLGGGTPSAVPADHLRQIFETVNAIAGIEPGAEVTAESNPNDLAAFPDMHALGINRLSIGAQAMDDDTLKSLGRAHTTADIRDAVRSARRAGFGNLNLDLIFGAPEQTLDAWKQTLDQAIDLQPEHLSVYGLTIEEGTNYWRRHQKGRLPLPEEEAQAAMYAHTLDRLHGAGFEQYEVSNFARPGWESQHNLACWERKPYLGVGLSAHSFLDGRRVWNTRDLGDYLERVEDGRSPVEGAEDLTPADILLEEILLGLRRPCGVPSILVSASRVDRLVRDRLIERRTGRVRLTREGLLLADWVSAELARDV